jgi:hypothetical protein
MKILHIIIGACLMALLPASQSLGQQGQQGQQGGGSSVTVSNPATNPAKTSSVDDPGRIPYQTSHQFTTTECTFDPDNSQCSFIFPSVPSGKRLVAQHIAVNAVLGSQFGTQVSSRISIGTQPVSFFFVPTIADKNKVPKANGDQSVLFYVDGGLSFQAVLAADVPFFAIQGVPPFVSITVSGYLLDCKVNLCAAIAP